MVSLLFPGSFDPFTKGHRDIAKRAAKLCDKLYVVVMNNTSKSNVFTLDERVAMAKKVLGSCTNIEVIGSDGLLVDIFKSSFTDKIKKG